MNDEDIYDNSDPHYGSEDESDLGRVDPNEIASVSVTGTDWTTETILSQLKKGNIELNPRFQRRDAWDIKRKSLFIESLILGLPVPQIVLAERQDHRGKYIVLDGKQRLLCLCQFTADASDQDYKTFPLSHLEIRPDIVGSTYQDLMEDMLLKCELTAFENQSIRTVVVRNWHSEALLFHVFLRLNRGSKPLSPQELRQALHPGPFLNFVDEAASASIAVRDILKLTIPDFRMRDVELLIRFYSFRHRIGFYRGDLKDFLDKSCAHFNKRWNALEGAFKEELRQFEDAHIAVKRTFGSSFNYSKWVNGRFEKRFNRAVFDVIISVFLSDELRVLIEADSEKCVIEYKSLCERDPKFIESIERTTKSLDATSYRFDALYARLNAAYQAGAEAPAVGIS